MSVFVSGVSFVLILVVSWLLARPFLNQTPEIIEENSGDTLPDSGPQWRLREAMDELEADRLAGKISEAEYLQSREEVLSEAARAELLRGKKCT